MITPTKLLSCSVVLLGTVLAIPAMAAPLPTCTQLQTIFAANPQISNLTTHLYQPGTDMT
jgi:hypothetical protein